MYKRNSKLSFGKVKKSKLKKLTLAQVKDLKEHKLTHEEAMNGSEALDKHMKIMMDGEGLLNMEDGAHSKLIIKRMTKNADGTTTEMDNNVMVFAGGVEGSHTAAMVSAAEKLLSQADSKDLSSRARRKLEKAQRAVKEAKEALAAEE